MCVDVCPAKSKTDTSHKAINMEPVAGAPRRRAAALGLLPVDPARSTASLLAHDTVKGTQVLEPLFEFSGACGGCGETPYLKLVSQLFGDRMIVANATGCSSIYGANLPTTPWTVNAAGRGPAWTNSLFEDNAEFGLGMRLALDAQTDQARRLVGRLAPELGAELVAGLLDASQETEAEIDLQRGRVTSLRAALGRIDGAGAADARHLLALADDLVRKGVWIIGGDGWAYDIGFGGVDQVLSSGRNVNILVLDTEVYSNTGGQASKSTPRGAVAKFAAAGKATAKKDLGAIARSYGNVYVAQISMGANDQQTTKALLEADAWPGPSLVIAYSTCIAHGIDMSQVDVPPEGRGQERLLAAVPLPPVRDRRRQAVQARLGDALDPGRGVRRHRDPLRGPQAHPPGARRRAGPAGPGRRRRALALLRAAGRHRADRAPHPPARPGDPARGRERRRLSLRRRGGPGMSVDLQTRYLGLQLRSPIVASASPLNSDPLHTRRLEGAGIGAIVLPSLFEEEILGEEIELNRALEQGTEHFAEALDYFPAVHEFIGAADRYLRSLEQIRAQAGVPVIASLNATSVGGWVRYARLMQDAGADALELNLYRVAADPRRTAADMEAADLDLIAAVRAAVTIPLAVKLSPYLLGPRPLRRGDDRCGRRRARPVQPLLPAGPRSRGARGRPPTRAEPCLGAPPARALDRDPAAPAG